MSTIIIPAGSIQHRPRIAYQNYMEDPFVTIGGDPTTDGNVPANLADWNMSTFWEPASGGVSLATFYLAAPKLVNYFAFYNQTLYLYGGTLTLQYSLDGGSTWLDAVTAAPGSNAVVYLTFDSITAQYWRIAMNSTTAARLSLAAFGQDMQLERGQWVGVSPPPYLRTSKVTTNISDNGALIGRSVIRTGHSMSLDLDFLTPSWVRNNWLPFMIHAESKPFYYLWNIDDYPNDAMFCWAEGKDFTPPRYSRQRYMALGLKAPGRMD